MYEHRCLENIKKLYNYFGKFDDKQCYKSIIESYMVYTPEGFTDNITISLGTYVPTKKPSARKSLRKILEALDLKQNTSVRRLGAEKSNQNATKSISMLWSSRPKRCGNTKINEQVKTYLYNWILKHPQVVQYPISSYCLKVSLDGHSETQLVPKLL